MGIICFERNTRRYIAPGSIALFGQHHVVDRDVADETELLEDRNRVTGVYFLRFATYELDGATPNQVDRWNDHVLTSIPLA